MCWMFFSLVHRKAMAVCSFTKFNLPQGLIFVSKYELKCTNVCWFSGVSLSVQQFGDHIQLGVISDAQIHPLHMKLSEGWTKNLEKLF